MRALISALILGTTALMAAPVQADEISDGKRVYMTKTCLACHGRNGARAIMSYPVLAGQNEAYLLAQLEVIKSGDRLGSKDETTGHYFVQGMADIMHLLSEDDLKNVSAYLASLPPAKPEVLDPAPSDELLAEGAKVYKRLACRSCHGKEGERASNKAYPIIAGLDRDYLIRQMIDIRDKVRTDGNARLMFGVIKRADDEDIIAMATWLSQIDRNKE
ncbi:MAG: cytochrome c4 [Rhodobacteraceae bacterium]|nr:cytochrome c4 [Paracoccaceae bacterium]